jgi:hypothetical protein
MSADYCSRCLDGGGDKTVLERGRKIPVCSDCVKPGDSLYVELPAGDALATVEPRCSL